MAKKRATKEPRLLDKIAAWLEHVRANGMTDEQMRAALGMDVPSFLKLIDRDLFGGLDRMQRLWPGAATWQVLRAAEEFSAGGWIER